MQECSQLERNPIFVALDLDDKDEVIKLAKAVQPFVGGFKIGPRLNVKYGSSLIEELSELGAVFVDNKYYDIPSTMESAIRSTFAAGATFTTVHVSSGAEALKKLSALEKELNLLRPFKILGVTILTSMGGGVEPPHWEKSAISEKVIKLADFGVECGLSGLVCSGEEVSFLREKYPHIFLVTPGIRFKGEEAGDQKRVVDPETALNRGASALVVGRPIWEAKDPVEMARKYYEAIN